MSASPPQARVLVMARAPRPGQCKARLLGMLGAQGCAQLQRVLLGRAAAWAHAVAPGNVHVAGVPAGSGAELAQLMGAVTTFEAPGEGAAERLSHAAAHVLEHSDGPLLVIGTAVPALSHAHARAALEDLEAGCDVSLGPTTGGSCYLLALATPQPALGRLAGPAKPTEQPLLARALAAASGLRLGLLRSERELATEADARALLADPRAPGEVRDALRSYAGAL